MERFILSEDETLSIMVNEEDHIRIQCIYPGFQLENAYEHADSVDNYLGKQTSVCIRRGFRLLDELSFKYGNRHACIGHDAFACIDNYKAD